VHHHLSLAATVTMLVSTVFVSACGTAGSATAQDTSATTTTSSPSTTTGSTTATPPAATQDPTSVAPPAAPTPAAPDPASSPQAQCAAKPSTSGEIIARSVTPDGSAMASQLGGGYVWDFGAGECVTAVEYVLRGNTNLPGFCTQVAYASTNPGYDDNAVPAPPLKDVVATAGSC
jgi:hypothetical protein